MIKAAITFQLNELDSAVSFLLSHLTFGDVVAVTGEMGAGKTTVIKALVIALQSQDHVSSPTFSIVNTYQVKNGLVHHFDLYRLKSFQELLDLGFDIYLEEGALVLIEWPELATPLMPDHMIRLQIEINNDQSRTITLAQA